MSGELALDRYVGQGDGVLWPQATGEPTALIDSLIEQRHVLGPVRVFLGLSLGSSISPSHRDFLRCYGLGGLGRNAELARAGALEVVPCRASQLPRLVEDGIVPADVVFIRVTPPDDAGNYNLGPVVDAMPSAFARARAVIAEVSPHVPWIAGDTLVRSDQVTTVVPSDRPMIEVPPSAPTAADREIGRRVCRLVPDGATLQVGLGSTVDAIVHALSGKSDLGVHSGLVTDAVLDLIRSGTVTNRLKIVDPGITVGAALLGTHRLYAFADRNPAVAVRGLSHTHNAGVLATQPALHAINSALEVDLTGQINAESADGTHVGAVGGQPDFMEGAMFSRGGRSIIALRATAGGGSRSRVVRRLATGTVTTARCDADFVVTEYGTAELRGRSLRERAEALIAIAHPQFRAGLRLGMADLC